MHGMTTRFYTKLDGRILEIEQKSINELHTIKNLQLF